MKTVISNFREFEIFTYYPFNDSFSYKLMFFGLIHEKNFVDIIFMYEEDIL